MTEHLKPNLKDKLHSYLASKVMNLLSLMPEYDYEDGCTVCGEVGECDSKCNKEIEC